MWAGRRAMFDAGSVVVFRGEEGETGSAFTFRYMGPDWRALMIMSD